MYKGVAKLRNVNYSLHSRLLVIIINNDENGYVQICLYAKYKNS